MKNLKMHLMPTCLLFVLFALPAAGEELDKTSIHITSGLKNDFYETVAVGTINASPEIVWEMLTDFDHHAEFVPNVIKSRVIKTMGASSIIDKEVKFAFKRVSMVLEAVIIIKNRLLRWHQQKGPFRINRGEWAIEKTDDGKCRVTYTLQVKPNFYVPIWMRRRLTESNVIKLFKALEKESIKRTPIK
ncbi:MAG: hypothetical protein CVV44_01305 [Spirochaetae bacterium HGW-Spirochaetae-1]|jgi:ribosome-associated toxin RatA of RatAB toxin-antitoxin module|nr:MAG: hypothetical protein CVV44_01305 [Spirochaetae bacterium HGW-Spirochaetae-1]